MAIVVPKGLTAWPDSHDKDPYRVEFLDRLSGTLDVLYFVGLEQASLYADANRSWGGEPCVVEARDLPATHEVRSLAVHTEYVLSLKRFGDLASARDEFERGKAHAQVHGGRYLLNEVGVKAPIDSFSHSVD